MEVVQRNKSAHHRRKSRRNLRIGRVRKMALAVHRVLMNLRVECAAELPHVPRELDHLLARLDPDHVEAMPRQPRLHRRNILVRNAKLLAELVRRKPLVIIRIPRRMQLPDHLIERRLLGRAALQQQVDPVQRCAVRRGSAIVLGIGQRMHRSVERHKLLLVYRIDDPYRGRAVLGHRRRNTK